MGAATVAALLSRGDALVLALLLTLATFDLIAGLAAVLAALAVLARLGTTSLAAMAGAQAVLGPAGASGPGLAALSAWLGAAALVVACPGEWTALPFGLAAALIVNGPAAGSGSAFIVRVLAMVAFVDLALAAGRWWPRAVTRPVGVTLGALSLLCGLLARPPGGADVGHAVRAAAVPEAIALLAAGIAVALVAPRVVPRVKSALGWPSWLQYTPLHRRQPSGAGREGELP